MQVAHQTRLMFKLLLVGPAIILVGSLLGAGLGDGIAGSSSPGSPIGYFLVTLGLLLSLAMSISVNIATLVNAFRHSAGENSRWLQPIYILLVSIVIIVISVYVNIALSQAVICLDPEYRETVSGIVECGRF